MVTTGGSVEAALDGEFGSLRGATGPSRRPEKVSDVIAHLIVKDVVANGMVPGDMLPSESQMLERFQVGRTSLREALRILEINGLIVIRSGPGGGPIVAAPTSQDFGRMASLFFESKRATFRELLQARLVLEPALVREAVLRHDPEMTARLFSVVNGAGQVAIESPSTYQRTISDFHGAISTESGNRILDLLCRGLKDVFNSWLNGMVFLPEDRERIQSDHREVVTAISHGDADKAERLMREHMEDFLIGVTQRYPGMLDEVVEWR
jgi:GntR family transcriptional repressor for pyruvate dehydrogenase complex